MACPAVKAKKTRGKAAKRYIDVADNKHVCPLGITPLPFPAVMMPGTNSNLQLLVNTGAASADFE